MPDEGALVAALAPPRALGAPIAAAMLRTEAEDFVVDEDLGFSPDGEGTHVLLRVRKRNANTAWVARELARAAGCHERDVGYAGLKDRHAVTTQWFSVPSRARPAAGWASFEGQDFAVLEAHAHRRKLPRGALAGNRFTIRLRALEGERELLRARLERVRLTGVPNYFGPQRFGRNGANLDRIAQWGSLRRHERSLVLSAARSLIFNAVLAARVQEGTWNCLEAGDVAMLDGRGSVFPVHAAAKELEPRAAALELHPTGPLWGDGEPSTGARILALERDHAARFSAATQAAVRARMCHERRSLRLAVRDLQYDLNGDARIAFRLTRGAYATSVLREIADCREQAGEGDESA